jgi:hypothetical protein
LTEKGLFVKAKEFKTDVAVVKDLEFSIGRVLEETWAELVGVFD